MGRRTWIKIYPDKWLRGSIRKEEYDIRSVFIDLLTLAGDSAYGDVGVIQFAEGVGVTDEIITGMLNIPMRIWLKAKDRLSNHPNPQENRIRIVPLAHGYRIEIINWCKYQSEYERQKTRSEIEDAEITGESGDSLTKSAPNVQGEGEGDREGEGERDRKREKIKEICVSFLNYFNLKTSRKLKMTEVRERIIQQRLKDGYTLNQLKKCVDNFMKDEWADRHNYMDIIYCIGIRSQVDNLERWLNYKAEKEKPRIRMAASKAIDIAFRNQTRNEWEKILLALDKEGLEEFKAWVKKPDGNIADKTQMYALTIGYMKKRKTYDKSLNL